MGCSVDEIGRAWTAAIGHPLPPVTVTSPPCQQVVVAGDDLRGPGRGLAGLPVPVSTPGFDAAPYLTATLCITRDPDTGVRNMGTYRAQLKATTVGCSHGFADRRRRRLSALAEISRRKEPMPCAIVIGCAPVVAFTGPQKLAVDQ